MSDSSEKRLSWIDEELAKLDRAGLRRTLTTRGGPADVRSVLDENELVHFGSNDYLGLAVDERLAAAACAAVAEEGWGSAASPLVSGRSRLHRKLEERLARFEGTEAALLFPSGFAANTGTIPALAARDDAIYGDAKNHASIIDGCRLSWAETHVYPHADCDALESLLESHVGQYRRRLIVTDSLFSMDGDLAPLERLAELAERHDAMLMVDEAHATGVFGQQGRGVCEYLGVEDRVHIRVGTLSKALGSSGGFVAGSRRLIDWLVNRARPYIFSTAPPAPAAAAAIMAIQIVQDEPRRRAQLLARAERLRGRIQSQGWHTGGSQSQIIPIMIGQPDPTMRLAAALREKGLLVLGIRPPSVPPGQSLLRISLSYGHSEEMVEGLVGALGELRKTHV